MCGLYLNLLIYTFIRRALALALDCCKTSLEGYAAASIY